MTLKYAIVFLLYFSINFSNKETKIFMIGDSTMAEKPERAYPENGWGMALKTKVKTNINIINNAKNGRSSKSFINEGLWNQTLKEVKKGDFVIIQFGHNDSKADTARFTEPFGSYQQNLKKIILDTKTKNGIPVLCTSIVRRKFNQHGLLENTHGEYPKAMRELALEMGVPLIDLELLTKEYINKIGEENSKDLFMILKPREYPNFPDGKVDNTHLKTNGAEIIATLFVKESQRQRLKIAKCFL